jgi:hypothetical protein
MALCALCNVETELFESDHPICLSCSRERVAKRKPAGSDNQVRSVLHDSLVTATERARGATAAFTAVVQAVPSAIPPLDGTQLIQRASRDVSMARVELMRAHNRLNDYLSRGIVPEDLKQNG